MGAEPEFFLLSVGFPPERGEDLPLAIARGAAARAAEFGARLVGGDLSSAPQVVVVAAFWGRPAGQPLTRAGARPGDVVYVSGHPGEAAAGLRLAQKIAAFHSPGGEVRRALGRSPEAPARRLPRSDPAGRPRASSLAREGLATAAIDVSDGLGVDAGRLARASGVRLVLERERLPVSSALRRLRRSRRSSIPSSFAVGGGDDYELLFTVPRSRRRALRRAGVGASEIAVRAHRARRRPAPGRRWPEPSGEREIAELGHDHFEAAR